MASVGSAEKNSDSRDANRSKSEFWVQENRKNVAVVARRILKSKLDKGKCLCDLCRSPASANGGPTCHPQ